MAASGHTLSFRIRLLRARFCFGGRLLRARFCFLDGAEISEGSVELAVEENLVAQEEFVGTGAFQGSVEGEEDAGSNSQSPA